MAVMQESTAKLIMQTQQQQQIISLAYAKETE
jgi:hypothetical protein